MARTLKLNDLQLILLAAAAQRSDGSLLPPPESVGDQAARIRKVLPPLIKRALVEEVEVATAPQAWRSDGDRHIGAIITDAGRAIIGAEEAKLTGEDSSKAEEPPLAEVAVEVTEPELPAPSLPPTSKIAQVLVLLEREIGATLAELVDATGWLPHTTRAALTGLRKKGHVICKTSRDGATCYHVGSVA